MFTWLARTFRNRRASSTRPRCCPRLELLEERCQPAPVVSYSSYLGGDSSDEVACVAIGPGGNIYLGGRANSDSGSYPSPFGAKTPQENGFVAEMNPAGQVVWATFIDSGIGGGNDTDGVLAIAVDGSGNVYATGGATLNGFATTGAVQTTCGTSGNAFVVKVDATTHAIDYYTYLGGNGPDIGLGIAADSAGDAFVTGYTTSTNFPTKNPLSGQESLQSNAGMDAFVTELNPTGSQRLFSTYLGGNQNGAGEAGATLSQGNAITLDTAGNIYLTGYTLAADFPSANPFQQNKDPGQNAFVTELHFTVSTGWHVLYSTFLGGSDSNSGNGIAVDSAGNILVAGETDMANFPLKNAFQKVINGNGETGGIEDAFVTKLNPNLTGSAQAVYSTYLGGHADDRAFGIAVDSAGNAYVTGMTMSADPIVGPEFPRVHPFQSSFSHGDTGAFVAEFAPTGKIVFSSFYGGGGETGDGIAADAFGDVVFVGDSPSAHLPTTPNAYQLTLPLTATDNGYVAMLAGTNHSYTGTDAAGDLISVKLSGPGAIDVVPTSTGSLQTISLKGTSSTRSTLTIKVTNEGGGGIVDLGSITGTGLKAIAAPSTDLTGSGIDLPGGLGSLTLHQIAKGTTIDVGGSLNLLHAARIGTAIIEATRIKKLTVTGDKRLGLSGDFTAGLTLTGTGTALGTVSISGQVSGSHIEVQAGSVTSFKAAAFVNKSTLFLGLSGILTVGARLGTFTITGPSAAFANSNVSASVVGTVLLTSVQTGNGGHAFGITGGQSIGKVKVTSPPFTYNPRGPASQNSGDFVVQLG